MTFVYAPGTLNLDIQPKLIDVQGNDLYPLLSLIPKRSISQTAIQWNADVGGASITGEAITAAGTTNSDYTSVVPATLPIGINRFRHTFTVQTTKMAEAASVGEAALVDLLKYAATTGMRQLLRGVATNLYAGTGNAASGGMVGMGQVHSAVTAALSTTTYAGIAPGTHARWSNYVNTAGTPRALTAALLFKMSEEIIGGVTLGVNANYTAIFTTPAMVSRYKELFQANSDIQVGTNGRADVGYSGVSFEGRPILVDPYCPPNTLYFVDDADLALYSFVESTKSFGDEEPAQGLNFKIVEMARTNPDAVQFAIVTKPQLQIGRRAAIAVLANITQ